MAVAVNRGAGNNFSQQNANDIKLLEMVGKYAFSSSDDKKEEGQKADVVDVSDKTDSPGDVMQRRMDFLGNAPKEQVASNDYLLRSRGRV